MQHEWRTIINGVSHQPLQAEKSHDGAGPRNQRQLQILQERHLMTKVNQITLICLIFRTARFFFYKEGGSNPRPILNNT